MHYYGLTIKATTEANKQKGIEAIDAILKKILRYSGSELFDIVYELDSKNLVHMHCTIISKIMLTSAVTRHRGFHVYVELCYNYDGWMAYIHKQDAQYKANQLIDYFVNNYGFIN